MIEPEHVYSWETAKDRNRKIKTANEEIAINKQRIKNHNDALSRADQLDDVIRSGRYDPIVEDIRSRIKENTGLLEAMFTKKEKAVMRGESADQNGRK